MTRYKLSKHLLMAALTYVLCTNTAFALKVGISLPSQNTDRYYHDGVQLQNRLRQDGYDVDLFYAGDNNSKLQLKQVQRMVDENYKMIVVSPINGKDYKKVLDEAHAKNITVVSYDKMILNSKNVDYFVTFNNIDIGVLQAQYLIEKLQLQTLGAKKNVELFAGDCRDNNAKEIWQGLKGELSEYFQNESLTVPSGATSMGFASIPNDSYDLALKRMEEIISKNGYGFIPGTKRLDAVVSPSDNVTAGIIKAFENAGFSKENLPLIIGTDISSRTKAYLKDKSLAMTVLKNDSELHEAVVTIAKSVNDGDKVNTKEFKMRDTYNGKANIKTLLCSSYVATSDEMSIDRIQFRDNYPKAIAKYLPRQIDAYRSISNDKSVELTKVIFKGHN